jgi:hypothetical protein
VSERPGFVIVNRRRVVSILLFATQSALAGCTTNGYKEVFENLDKGYERAAYNELARIYSQYCATMALKGPYVDRFRAEGAREIRQQGRYGPAPPSSAYSGWLSAEGDYLALDTKARLASGPIVMIYCRGDDVPEDVWRYLDRWWKQLEN